MVARGEPADAEPLGDLRIRASLFERPSAISSATSASRVVNPQAAITCCGDSSEVSGSDGDAGTGAAAGADTALRCLTTRRATASTRAISSSVRNGFVT